MGIQLHYRVEDLEEAALASGSEFTRSTTSFVYHDYDEHGLEVAVFDKRYSVSIDGQYIGTTGLNPFEVREVLQVAKELLTRSCDVSIPLKSGRCCKSALQNFLIKINKLFVIFR